MQSEVNRDKAIRRRVGTPFILAEWRAMRTFASVGTVNGVLFIATPSERQLHYARSAPGWPTASSNIKHVYYWPTTSRWSPDDAPTANAWSGIHSHWPSRQHWGVGSANVKRAFEESTWWPCCHMASCRRSPQTPLARAETALSFCSKEQFRSSHELDFSTN